MILADVHAHLQDEIFNETLPEVIARAKSAGIFFVNCCATHSGDWGGVTAVSKKFTGFVRPFYGVHPWWIDAGSAFEINALKKVLEDDLVAGVGEIGLDFSQGKPDRDQQIEVFEEQLNLARDLMRPVSIHCVRAWGPLIAVLKSIVPLPAGGIVHAFGGSIEVMRELLGVGLGISISGRSW